MASKTQKQARSRRRKWRLFLTLTMVARVIVFFVRQYEKLIELFKKLTEFIL